MIVPLRVVFPRYGHANFGVSWRASGEQTSFLGRLGLKFSSSWDMRSHRRVQHAYVCCSTLLPNGLSPAQTLTSTRSMETRRISVYLLTISDWKYPGNLSLCDLLVLVSSGQGWDLEQVFISWWSQNEIVLGCFWNYQNLQVFRKFGLLPSPSHSRRKPNLSQPLSKDYCKLRDLGYGWHNGRKCCRRALRGYDGRAIGDGKLWGTILLI
jgi:hypothetical protein